jgi:hypothetical protein
VQSTKIIFSRRIKDLLIDRGFEPIRRFEDVKRPGFWIWEFQVTPAFLKAFEEVAFRKEGQND